MKKTMRMVAGAAAALLVLGAWGAPAAAQQRAGERWMQYRPDNTGIPGEQLIGARFAPDGKLWVGARWPFWSQGGYGIYDIENDTWETISSYDSPLPDQWARGVIFEPAPNEGVVWMATNNGLARKDGENWTIYTTANAPFYHNRIERIARAPDGKIWVLNADNSGNTGAGALFSFDGENWTEYRCGPGGAIPFTSGNAALGALTITPDGHVWIGHTLNNGIAEFDGTSWTLHGTGVGRLGGGMVDGNGDLWFLPAIGGGEQFWRYRRQANQWDTYNHTNSPISDWGPGALGLDQQGRVYVGDRHTGDIGRFENETWTHIAQVGGAIKSITPHPVSGELWVATLHALVRLDQFGGEIRRYNTYNTGMPWYWIDNFDLDREGNFWMAGSPGGLSRFDGEKWRNWGRLNAGAEPYPFGNTDGMSTLYMDRFGQGWMGGDGIARWDPASGQFTGFWDETTNPSMGSSNFVSFAEDSAGTLFCVNSYGELFRFDGFAWVKEPPSTTPFTGVYGRLRVDPQGRLWAFGAYYTYLWDGAAWTEVGQHWDLFGKGGHTVARFADDGTLYIGTGAGLMRITDPPNGAVELLTPGNSPLPATHIHGLDIRRSDGAIAISARDNTSILPFPGGVSVITGDISNAANWKVYRYGQDPIAHSQIGVVGFDGEGNLWISAWSEGCSVLLADTGGSCYANCDGSALEPVLNIDDFTCFINEFATSQALPHAQQVEHYANCDGSTAAPALNVDDFTCFINEYAAGCP